MTERRSIEILGKTFSIDWSAHISGGMGEFDYDNLIIHLARGLPEQRTISNALHEAIEVINADLELKLDQDTIERLETAMFALLVRSGVDLRPLIWEDGA